MVDAIGFTLGGFVAGEGWFGTIRRPERFAADSSPRLRFVFAVAVAERDRLVLDALRTFLGAGSVTLTPARLPQHLPGATFAVVSSVQHRRSTIPFAARYLRPSAKRAQFQRWREQLDQYERERPTRYGRGPSPCSVAGCDRPVRGRGLCRVHYYRATGL